MASIMVRREKVLNAIGFDRNAVCESLWAMVERERDGLPFIDYLEDKPRVIIKDKGVILSLQDSLYTNKNGLITVVRGRIVYTGLVLLINNLIASIRVDGLPGIIKAANNPIAEFIVLNKEEQDAFNKAMDFKSVNAAYNALRSQLKDEYKNELDSIMVEVYL